MCSRQRWRSTEAAQQNGAPEKPTTFSIQVDSVVILAVDFLKRSTNCAVYMGAGSKISGTPSAG